MCMARRRTKRKTRRRKQGISIINLAETYMLTGVLTQTLFNVNPWTFVAGDYNAPSWGMSSGTQKIGLAELFQSAQGATTSKWGQQTSAGTPTMDVIAKNFKENWMAGIAGMVLIPIGFKFAKQLARPATSRANRLLNKSGIGSTVKL